MTTSKTPKFCSECGSPFEQGARFCGKCGTATGHSGQQKKNKFTAKFSSWRQGQRKAYFSHEPKNKAAITLLALFLGGFGIHKFYMGSWGWGIVYLLTSWSFVPFLIALVEAVRFILLTDEEFKLKFETFVDKGPFGFFW